MFRTVVNAIKEGRSPLLFTGVEGKRMGRTAVLDGQAVYGDPDIVITSDSLLALPAVKDGVLVERITTPPCLILCGAGHVSTATAKIAKMVGFQVTVIDDRSDFANRERFPEADCILNQPFSEALDSIDASNAYYVIVTRGHKDDRLCLETVLKKPFTYCGMIGSKSKIQAVSTDLKQNGFSEEQLQSVHAPIGLPIGANTPEEIAVCIVSEMIQVKNKETSGSEWDEPLCRAIETMNEPYAMVTLISKRGSAPRSTGARMIVKPDGIIISSIGGGFGEYEAAERAKSMLRNGPKVMRYTCRMNNSEAAQKGMICGGTIDILIQITEA